MVHRARFVEVGILHQYSAGDGSDVAYSVEGPGEPRREPQPAVRLVGRPVGGPRLWRNRSWTDRIDASRGCHGGCRAVCTVVLGSALIVADGSARFVPF